MKIINIKNIRAVIFDMDGTMIDNMSTHKEAWKEFCSRKCISLSDADFKKKVSGFKNDQIFINLFGNNLSESQIAKYADEKESVYRELYKSKIKEVSGLKDTLLKIKRLSIKLAIATTAPKANRDFTLRELHLNNYFDVILGEEDVKKGKPDPEIYLETAKLLNIKPNSCLVFEDSPAGLQSGKDAGMKVVALTTSHSKEELLDADLIVENFSKLDLIQ